MFESEKRFYTVREFAEATGYSTDRVYEWVRRGHIQATKVTDKGNWRIPASEIKQLEKGRNPPKAPTREETTRRDNRLEQHFDDLAKVAKALHEAQHLRWSYADDETPTISEFETFSGIYRYNPSPSTPLPKIDKYEFLDLEDNSVSVYNPHAMLFFEHFRQEFPELGLQDWKELLTQKMPQKTIDRLRYWAHTSRFKYSPTCEVCRDLGT